ncbi:shikimate kinase [Phenylobacterium sp. 20VBR1]|uniref:Shikimate kinase n=1 Tax=Phenylobacterium glaciei TaxID=2803784 RepID=A0A941D2Q4_9CAUL|nr:shikimate kinase [Phenylobacterium glaciei]MBR7621205.1 shikimate kinase [Phenylobacterium glaciei]
MELIFLHGPAAVGKLTVARELTARTGFALFHNHLVVDAVYAVFEFGTEPFIRLREQMWLSVFEEAAKIGRSLVFTFAPEHSVPVTFPADTQAVVERHGGRVRFVELTAPVAEQERRIDAESRVQFGKLRDLEMLRDLRAKGVWDYPAIASELVVDTGANAPEQAAEIIIQALGLTRS